MKNINFQAVDFYTGQVCKVDQIRFYNQTCHIIRIDEDGEEDPRWRHYAGQYKNCELTYAVVDKGDDNA